VLSSARKHRALREDPNDWEGPVRSTEQCVLEALEEFLERNVETLKTRGVDVSE
jgi:hypothetical protein